MKIKKKMKHKNFTLGGLCPGGFCRGYMSGGVFVLEPLPSYTSSLLLCYEGIRDSSELDSQ